MEKALLNELKRDLLTLRGQLLNSGILRSREDLQISSDDLPDETDLAASVIQQQVSFHMRERELSKLRSIEAALERLENNCYGLCDECNEFIGQKRLKNQPWVTLCITHAEEQERRQARFISA